MNEHLMNEYLINEYAKFVPVSEEIQPKVESVMVWLEGSKNSFRCECGCNVFHKTNKEPNVYICNACDARYIGL